ncbi:hypothetical protein Salat_1433900 [Sesamum alatum]|uniref:Uncharacterized protein n=1 Tax=Sesamum alatum TaxID=300844 RepID=A0AAE1YAR0_9LAMI|nr:hypothetical protein Salat_1433900 [Sesamum alatum]
MGSGNWNCGARLIRECCCMGFSQISTTGCAEIAEALPAREAVELSLKHNWTQITIEGDCLTWGNARNIACNDDGSSNDHDQSTNKSDIPEHIDEEDSFAAARNMEADKGNEVVFDYDSYKGRTLADETLCVEDEPLELRMNC